MCIIRASTSQVWLSPIAADAHLYHSHRTMVIAVITVGVVQTSIYQIVVVIAMWNEWMSASIMSALTCNGGADIGVIGADCNHMLIIVPLVRVVQMSVMQIIHVPVVKNANVPTMLAVDMRMRFVNRMRHHSGSFPPGRLIRRACVCHLPVY